MRVAVGVGAARSEDRGHRTAHGRGEAGGGVRLVVSGGDDFIIQVEVRDTGHLRDFVLDHD
ncbi:hypothetical protein AB0H88_38985 [Nonomuraea sp. NPDC050680]|uniref:hypothetical protein n=1 Tax=Nonomuraea sp. NPDC050680 TaxID=3154630 RepID=UPI0033F09602